MKKQKETEYNKIMDALNTVDEFACESSRCDDYAEAKELENAYELVADFIAKNAKK